jgi:DNA-binding GntR family transcriptional regulator
MVATPPPGSSVQAPPGDRLLRKEQAHVALKQRLVTGELQPGAFLSERQLVALLGMSKTPIRAALERLEAEGYVPVSARRGALVRELSVRDIVELFEIRTALETYVLEALAGRVTPAQARRLQANVKAQCNSGNRGDSARSVTLDMEFHVLFAEFLGSGEITRVVAQLHDKIYRIIMRVHTLHGDCWKMGWQEHNRIAELVLAGDGPAAARVVREHLENGKQMIMAAR